MSTWIHKVCAGLVLLASVGAVYADAAIGTVKTLKGEVNIERNGALMKAAPGMKLMTADKLVTGANSAVGIALQDSTLMSLGAKSATQLNEFRYDPVKRDGNLLISVLKGSMRFVTGLLGKQNPAAVGIRTPTATIGIRGTDFVVSVADKE
ncbi:MAG: FecR domain-containing protein [Nitrosomonadales bacterium]|nr:FecR domain-containing protein [Nitrosomonadales bacterium]